MGSLPYDILVTVCKEHNGSCKHERQIRRYWRNTMIEKRRLLHLAQVGLNVDSVAQSRVLRDSQDGSWSI